MSTHGGQECIIGCSKKLHGGEKRVSLQYVAKITVDGAGEFQKEFLLTLGEEEEGWRVMNYSEFDCCTIPHS